MGWSLSSLIPKNTIVGKALSGDIKGAVNSAKNYVTSGELATDFKNITTQNIGAIANKAVTGYQGNGNLLANATKSVLDKGTNITSLKPTPVQAEKADQAQASANIALAVGSGVPIAQAQKMQSTPAIIGGNNAQGMAQESAPPPASGENNNTLYYVLGGVGLIWLLGSKKRRNYIRRYARKSYSTGRNYARRYTRRAMSYIKRRRY